MQLATWNVNSLNVRLPQVLDWLQAHPVDVLALQELKLTDDKFPVQAFTDIGYQAQWFGQKTYNGVALLSKVPAVDVIKNIPGFQDEQSRVLCGTFDGVRVICAYFPNGQEPGSDKFAYKMRWLDALREWLRAELAAHPQLVLMGDYNITFDALDMWDPIALAGTIHCTDAEREKLQALIDLAQSLGTLPDSFSGITLQQGLSLAAQGAFQYGGGDLPLLGHLAQPADGHTQAIGQGSRQPWRLFHNAVELFTPQHTRLQALNQLRDGGLRRLRAGARQLD